MELLNILNKFKMYIGYSLLRNFELLTSINIIVSVRFWAKDGKRLRGLLTLDN